MNGKKRKPKYFPNNWKAIKDAPDEVFDTCSWDDFNEWKIHNWQLPESVVCIIREECIDGLVREHVYQRKDAALRKLQSICMSGGIATVADQESIDIVFGDFSNDQD